MIGTILSIILKIFEGRRVINQTKKAGLIYYIKVLSTLRVSLMGVAFLILAFQIFVFSLVGLIIMGVYLAPIENDAKVWVLFGLCSVIFLITVGLLVFAFSEKNWLKYSGATELISKID